MSYFVYRHIRTDTNTPFYIGIGKTRNGREYKTEYGRAYERFSRNEHWLNIVNKVNYEVEIIYEHSDVCVIKEKEIEFIALYGRSEFGGLLCNMTDGGDGTKNMSQESKNKI